jgi:hypothetical protein
LNRFGAKPNLWSDLIKKNNDQWQSALEQSMSGQKVLIATSLGGYDHAAIIESSLAVALTLRGANVEILLCDESLPACQLTKITKIAPEELLEKTQKRICERCYSDGLEMFKPLGLKIHRYGDYLKQADSIENIEKISEETPVSGISAYKLDGVAVGEHAYAGALRYYARGDLENEPLGESVLRKYFKASLLTTHVVSRLLEVNNYDVVCFHHGIYVPQGLIGEVCRKKGVRIVNWNPAYRKHCFIFSHGNTYHHTMITEPVSTWENIQWSPDVKKDTIDYLNSRWSGTQDWIWFHEDPQEEIAKIAQELGVDFSKPCIGLLTNVMWDAQLHYKSNAFSNMLDWVIQTISYFKKRPELQLIIRVHPAEIRGMIPSRQPLVPEIMKRFPKLPPNIFIIAPESRISTYAVMQKCNTVIIYNTKTGIEVSSMGIPVVVTGEAWIRGKGFSLDANSPREYFEILDKLPMPQKMTHEETERALKYAYHFFFRRMIPLPFVTSPETFKFSLNISGFDELSEGKYLGLDVICDGILKESSFVYDRS